MKKGDNKVYITIEDANRHLRGWRNLPNFSATGSLTGMQKHYGYKRGKAFRIGGYYYNFDGSKLFDKAKSLAK